MTEWAVVLECEADGDPNLDLHAIERLVDLLAPWRASALHNADRYALQVVLDAGGPVEALRVALELQLDASSSLGLPAWGIVRSEVMTLPELERSWETELCLPPLVPKRAWEINPLFAVRVHDVGRALLRSSSVGELSDVLAGFVRDTGGQVVGHEGPFAWTLPEDLSLGNGNPRFAAAEPFSTCRLFLEEVLPSLVEDARHIFHLMRPL